MCMGKPSSRGCLFLFTSTLERDYIKKVVINSKYYAYLKKQTIIDVFSKGFVKTHLTRYFLCCMKCQFVARVVRAGGCKRGHVIWTFKLLVVLFAEISSKINSYDFNLSNIIIA